MATDLNIAAHNSKLKEFFVAQLQDIYWAEKKLEKTLPKLEVAACSMKLREAFRNHFEQTKKHESRLVSVFNLINEPVIAQKCPAMSGIVEESEDIIDSTEEATSQRDVGLIFAGQKAEHYEIATYGGLVSLARILGYKEAANILEQTLIEEKETDTLLTQIAEHNVNYEASLEPNEV
jgi:ferritin-like metal-binding protein YciE